MYVDDLLIASQHQKEGEDFLAKLMAIWKMKITGRIGLQTKGALEFLGRSIYRAKDGESALYFGVSRQYMVGIFESWGENVKAGHTGLMPKLEDVHKEYVFFLSTAERAIKHCRSSGCHRKMRINHQDIEYQCPEEKEKLTNVTNRAFPNSLRNRT